MKTDYLLINNKIKFKLGFDIKLFKYLFLYYTRYFLLSIKIVIEN